MERKKSQTNLISWSFGALILLLVLMVILVAFLNKSDEAMKKMSFDKACNEYIKYSIIGTKIGLITDLNDAPCVAEDITIDKKTDFDVLKEIMDRQVECYNSFDRGKSELMSIKNRDDIAFCSVCSKINFTNKNLKIEGRTYIDFMGLMEGKERYIDILAPQSFATTYVNGEWKNNPNLREIILDTSKDYIVVFRYEKKTGKIWRWMNTFSVNDMSEEYMLIGNVVGFQTVYDKYNTAIFFAEFDSDLMKSLECDVILGIQQPGITSSS